MGAIHSTAIIEDGAVLGDGAEIGPFCHVGAQARLGDGVRLISHVVISGATSIGAGTVIHPFASIGGPPQHLGYKGEPTVLEIGAECTIREHVTMNPGTPMGGGVTRIGDRGFFMVGAHVAHDCNVGDGVIFANNAALAGHVHVGNGAFIGGLAAVHQFCRIGDYAFIGGCAALVGDVIPYASAFGNHAMLAGLNIIGMKRRGVSRETIHALRGAYRMLFGENDTFRERLEQVRQKYGQYGEVGQILDFIEASGSRPLTMPAR